MTLRQIPLLLPLILLIAGIILGHSLNFIFRYWYLFFLTPFIGFAFLFPKRMVTCMLSIGFIVIGFFAVHVTQSLETKYHFTNFQNGQLIVLVKKVEKTKKGFRIEGKVKGVINPAGKHKTLGKLLLYTDSFTFLLPHRSYLIPNKTLPIDSYKNPGFFDYGHYLQQKGFYYQSYVKGNSIEYKNAGFVLASLMRCAEYIDHFFHSQFQESRNAAFINALFLGRKKDLDSTTRDLFTNNGLAHLLAISGMHVGIVFLLLKSLLILIPNHFFRQLLILLGIWGFIAISGLQIPACRAGVMLTSYIIGLMLNRNSRPLNSVLLAAMVLLVIDSKLIFQISFQLSFLAMTSILLFYQPLLKLAKFRSPLLQKIWQLVALTLSVQILILPLTIYYFKQLPTYFLFTSIISIPFITITLWGAVICLAVSTFGELTEILTTLLESIINFYFELLSIFDKLPHALIENISLHAIQVCLWLIFALTIHYFFTRNVSRLWPYCISFLPVLFCSSYMNIIDNSREEMIVYDVKEGLVIDYINAQTIQCFADNRGMKTWFFKQKNDDAILISNLDKDAVFSIGATSFLVVDSSSTIPPTTIDICILKEAHFEGRNLSLCQHVIVPQHINCNPSHPNTHYMQTHGAFQLKISKQ